MHFTHEKDIFLLSVDAVQLTICRMYHRSSLGFLLKRKYVSKKGLLTGMQAGHGDGAGAQGTAQDPRFILTCRFELTGLTVL